ncbi:uracil-DNA glycosylase [Marinibacterium profundimaris]|uniref:Type-4 uracil-DNA glycosylase n=1 Tax=Marinibacterium profundimaris TaxID=1679460 RepID=A0A225NQ68_9RHOB|nr:uracil-DNA glycosylase [Marinibacterium profundimaris]OWU73387.1 uracil-DNA glycosylase [Marinibacterium profundimaris]
MGIYPDIEAAEALLAWQVELGATEAICDAPVNRYDLEQRKPPQKAAAGAPSVRPGVPVPLAEPDPVEDAMRAARAAGSLEELRAALEAFEGCALKKGARSTVFCDGVPGARVMIIGEAPGRDEDREGKPFVGRAGQLLDRMLGAVGLSRADSAYITNVLPWRPPQNRDPKPDEIAMMKPFLEAHVRLAKPEVLVIMGNISCQAMLGKRGITRLRGRWDQALDRPALPMFHPAYLLRNPQAKREAWADMLELRAKLGI